MLLTIFFISMFRMLRTSRCYEWNTNAFRYRKWIKYIWNIWMQFPWNRFFWKWNSSRWKCGRALIWKFEYHCVYLSVICCYCFLSNTICLVKQLKICWSYLLLYYRKTINVLSLCQSLKKYQRNFNIEKHITKYVSIATANWINNCIVLMKYVGRVIQYKMHYPFTSLILNHNWEV